MSKELLLERYPGLSFQLFCMPWEPVVYIQKTPLDTFEKHIPWEKIDLLYLYSMGPAFYYPPIKKWLAGNAERRVIFLEEELGAIDQLLEDPLAEEILTHPRICLHFVEGTWKASLSALAATYPSSRPFLYGTTKRLHAMRAHLHKEAQSYMALFTDTLYSDRIFAHVLKNLVHMPKAFFVNAWKGKFANVPAILTGAGPSLLDSIDVLKTLRDKALILAGGSAIPALIYQGVMPHLAMALDPNEEEYARLCQASGFTAPLLYGGRLHPQVFSLCKGPLGYIRSGTGGPMEGYIEQELGIHGPDMGEHLGKEALSVTTLGLALLTFLGCNPIFFVGVDLACQGKEHYAPGFTAHVSETRLVRRKGIGGMWVRTQDKWILEAEALGAFIKKHPATRFIDTKKSGLPIPHAHNLPLIHEWNARDLVGYIQGLIQSSSLGVSCDALSALKHTIHTSLHAVHTAYSSPPAPLTRYELEVEPLWQHLFCYLEAALDMHLETHPEKEAIKKERLCLAAKTLLVQNSS